MNFLRLNDYLLSILFEDDEILAIDKPYGINSHTNDAKTSPTSSSDVHTDDISDGLIEIYEKQLKRKLHIVHRLDQTTTGVIIFAKSQEAAKKYAEYFFNREVKKTYLFITAAQTQQESFFIDQSIVHKAKELEASTEFSVLKKSEKFSLWQANPLTGRNHQIRIHAKAAEIPIIGDEKYGGYNFPFLSLHNHKIEFPNGIIIKSAPPKYFEDLNLLENQILVKALFETDRRTRLFSATSQWDQCFRLVHNKDSGFTIDQFGKVLMLSSYNEDWAESDTKTFSYFSSYIKKPILVRKMHNRGKDPLNKSNFVIQPQPDAPPLEAVWIAKENNINYEMRSDTGQSFGLFLDQRLQRNWILNNSKEKVVLNLFSYTCGFSVAAALGGALQVTSIDTSKNVLNWGKKNFEINNLDQEKHKFLVRDSLDFLEYSLKKNIKYDIIVCDPPSFSRGEKGVFKIESNLEALLKNCLSCLNPNGHLLFSTNFENFYIDDIRKAILKVKSALGLQHLEINSIQPGLDFELAGIKPVLKSFLIKV
ncbi:MAG: class I SAM-dependent methyltransferase [Bdellovibrionota bacterium]